VAGSKDLMAFKWLMGQTVGLGLLAAAAIAITIVGLRSDAIEAAGREQMDLAIVIAREIAASDRAIETALDQAEALVKTAHPTNSVEFRQALSNQTVFEALRDHIAGPAKVDVVSFSDAFGNLVGSSRSWPAPAINFSHEDDFVFLSENESAATYVGRPEQSVVTRDTMMYFARRLNGPDGKFLGMVHVGLSENYFYSLYSEVFKVKDKSLLIARRDGAVLIVYPQNGWAPLASFATDSPWVRLARAGGGSYMSPGYSDGVRRLAAVLPLEGTPLVVDVAQREDAILSLWRKRCVEIGVGAALALLCAGFLAKAQFAYVGRLLRSESSLAAKGRDLERLNARFGGVLDNLPQGVAMFSRDRRLIVCNRRYAEMYQLSAEEIQPGMLIEEILELRAAKGIYVGDPESYVSRRLIEFWSPPARQTLERLSDGRVFFITRRVLVDGNWLTVHEDVTARQLAEDEIERLALRDQLTGAANRALLLREMARRLGEDSRRLGVLLLDLDEFKAVNDTHGHPTGDALLKAVAERLRLAVGEGGLVARIGGDEFAILAPDAAAEDDFDSLACCLLERIREPFQIEGDVLAVRPSVGVACAPRDGDDVETLLRNADLALYRAKSEGRDRVVHFEPILERDLRDARQLKAEMAEALARGQFEVHYQPIVGARGEMIIDVEALARWRHPYRGMISPDVFIKLAEENGQIQHIGEFVLREACARAARWPRAIGVSINLSPGQFAHGNLVALVADALASSGLEPGRLTLEITETALMENIEASRGVLAAIRDIGVRIALDDFGTGYSSLSYLQSFTLDEIKIDRSFVTEMETNPRTRAIVALIASIAKCLDARTVAEGVETQAQLDLVIAAGCDAAQGYLFARPRPISELSLYRAGAREVA
jgi:diguanylate cyclase (GGDEF)-like protein